MNRISLAIIGVFLAVSLGSTDALARKDRCPIKRGKDTVRQILLQPVEGRPVALEGRVIRKMGPNRLLFGDKTGEICLELSDDQIARINTNGGTVFRLNGDIELRIENPPLVNVCRMDPRHRG